MQAERYEGKLEMLRNTFPEALPETEHVYGFSVRSLTLWYTSLLKSNMITWYPFLTVSKNE